MSIRTKLRQFDKKRRQKSRQLEGWLLKQLARFSDIETALLAHDEVKRILVVRTNKRIGNMLFLIPFLRQVKASHPRAEVDLLLSTPWQVKLLAGLGISNCYHAPLDRRGIPTLLRNLKAMRQRRYDLLLMPYSSSTDTFLSAFIHARNKMARAFGERHQVFQHSITPPPRRCHAAMASLVLLPKQPLQADHHLALTEIERENAQQAATALRAEGKKTLAFFRGARGEKQLSDDYWQTLLSQVEHNSQVAIQWVEILSPDIAVPLRTDCQTYQCADFRQLGATLAALDGFICCDTGPLHLADAAGARCYGLFSHTDPLIFGCIGKHCLNLAVDEQAGYAIAQDLNKPLAKPSPAGQTQEGTAVSA